MDLLHKFQPILETLSLYRKLTRNWLDFTNIIYGQDHNFVFHDELESVQYNAWLPITDTIRGTSSKKPYQALGLESPKCRR